MDTRKSLSGFVFTLFGITISWKKNQSLLVALSTRGVHGPVWIGFETKYHPIQNI